MIIAIVVPAVVTAACLAEVARRAHLGHRLVEDIRSDVPASTVRILRTEEELQSALRRVSEAERLKARQAVTRADYYLAIADSVTGNRVAVPAALPVRATA
jgi:hypothetical protein